MALRIEAVLSGLRVSATPLPPKSRLWAERRKVTQRKLLLW